MSVRFSPFGIVVAIGFPSTEGHPSGVPSTGRFPNFNTPREGNLCITTLEGRVLSLFLRRNYFVGGGKLSHMGENSTPGPKPSVTDKEILEVFRETGDPALSTAEVAEQIPLERRSVYNRLVSLRDEGLLDSKKIGGRNSIWWLSGN